MAGTFSSIAAAIGIINSAYCMFTHLHLMPYSAPQHSRQSANPLEFMHDLESCRFCKV